MRPSDETPAPDRKYDEQGELETEKTEQKQRTENDSLHINRLVNTCQGSPPGEPPGESDPDVQENSGSARQKLARYYFRYLAHPTEEHRAELLCRCQTFLQKFIGYQVYGRGFCPASSARDEFVELSVNRVMDMLLGKAIPVLRNGEGLSSWLRTTALNAMKDQMKKADGRSKAGRYRWEPLEYEYADGAMADVLYRAENRDAAIRYRSVSVATIESNKQVFLRDILTRAAKSLSQRQQLGLKFLELVHIQGLTYAEIADKCGMSLADVVSIVRSARKRLKYACETSLNLFAEDL